MEEMKKEKLLSRILKKKKSVITLAIVVAALLLIGLAIIIVIQQAFPSKATIMSQAFLKHTENRQQLSTYLTTYQGVVVYPLESELDKADYYARYEATAKIGFDFSKVSFESDEETKTIYITIPKLTANVSVAEESVTLLFRNNKFDVPQTQTDAYKLCKADAEAEIANMPTMFEHAQSHAKKIIRGLTEPLRDSLYPDYKLEIR